MPDKSFTAQIYDSILQMATDDGINASGREEIYGCIFGRDSFITILKLLKTASNKHIRDAIDINPLLEISKRSLSTLISLQGRETNLESGEEPGKFIHEYRKEKFEHLVNRPVRPWFLYPDNVMRNYDSLDSTPLGLIAIYKYWKLTSDDAFLLSALPAIEAGLNWIITYGDKDKDSLVEYELPDTRIHGGLKVQSWTDSHESLVQADGSFPVYPIAPVEVQGYAWLALKLWADFYQDTTNKYMRTDSFAKKLENHADQLKRTFNELFLFETKGLMYPAQALDGIKNQIKTVTGNPLILLWATYFKDNKRQCVLEDEHIGSMVKRAFMPDMFDPDAGVRTMSSDALTYITGENNYHNGSFWPKLNGLSHEGLINWDFMSYASKLKKATLKPIKYFGSPIELYVKNDEGQYLLYKNERGQQSCLMQAWSAASALDLLTQ